MAPLIVFVLVTALARIAGSVDVAWLDSWPHSLTVGLAAMFLLTSTAHFIEPRRSGLVAIVPFQQPSPSLAVTVTGVLEVAGAIGLLVPDTRRIAAACLAALLVAMFPANVYAARGRRHPNAPSTPLPLRTAMQLLWLAAAVVVAVVE
ncbi:DoxX family protein [Nocardia brevicatena]|uniref:DoxX family protein n=1 Tax=Nocardia brevicatena TaxID=37327 RepID=UPI00031EE5B6|nr:DoxX family protein [Nocardia brevicatena]